MATGSGATVLTCWRCGEHYLEGNTHHCPTAIRHPMTVTGGGMDPSYTNPSYNSPSVSFPVPLDVEVNHGGINRTKLYAVCGQQGLVLTRAYGEQRLTWVSMNDVRLL